MSQQSTAFIPLVRQFIVLLQIARRTCQDDIIHIMSGGMLRTAQGNGMLKMEDVGIISPLKLGRTVVAGILLCFQFGLYLLRGKRSFYRSFPCLTSLPGSTVCYSTPFSSMIGSLLFSQLLTVLFIIIPPPFISVFSMRCMVLSTRFTKSLNMSRAIGSHSLDILFSMFLVMSLPSVEYLYPFRVSAFDYLGGIVFAAFLSHLYGSGDTAYSFHLPLPYAPDTAVCAVQHGHHDTPCSQLFCISYRPCEVCLCWCNACQSSQG